MSGGLHFEGTRAASSSMTLADLIAPAAGRPGRRIPYAVDRWVRRPRFACRVFEQPSSPRGVDILVKRADGVARASGEFSNGHRGQSHLTPDGSISTADKVHLEDDRGIIGWVISSRSGTSIPWIGRTSSGTVWISVDEDRAEAVVTIVAVTPEEAIGHSTRGHVRPAKTTLRMRT